MEIIFLLIILIFSIVIHEVAHGSAADLLGDSTARYAGRLTLNPLKHLDFMGSFFVPLLLVVMQSPFLIGWAKPVPVNPYNLRDQKYGQLKVAAAGPSANLIVALFFGLLIRFSPNIAIESAFLLSYIVFINILLAVFNLMPIPPLDGSHILFTFFPKIEHKFRSFYARMGFLSLPLVFLFIFIFFPVILQVVFRIFELFTGTTMIS